MARTILSFNGFSGPQDPKDWLVYGVLYVGSNRAFENDVEVSNTAIAYKRVQCTVCLQK